MSTILKMSVSKIAPSKAFDFVNNLKVLDELYKYYIHTYIIHSVSLVKALVIVIKILYIVYKTDFTCKKNGLPQGTMLGPETFY